MFMKHKEALAQLDTIKTLIDRSIIYRALSAPTAAFAGSVSLAAATLGVTDGQRFFYALHENVLFWSGILVCVVLFNFVHFYITARREGEPLFTPRARMAYRALLPELLTVGR
jgi:hypothetical protein